MKIKRYLKSVSKPVVRYEEMCYNTLGFSSITDERKAIVKINKKNYFYVYMCHVCWVAQGVGKSILFTGVGILSGCQLPEMGTGNRPLILWKLSLLSSFLE